MSVQKNEIYDLLKRLEIILERSFPILPNYLVAIKLKEVESIIDSIYGSLPQEVQEARRLLRRKEELQMEAQQKAEKIVLDAQNEANRMLSESELMRQVQKEAELIKEQVIAECEEIKRKALEDAENFRNQAHDDAMRTKEGADAYADQVLVGLDNNLNQLQQSVKNAQIYMEKLRTESSGGYDPLKQNYPSKAPQTHGDEFKID
ncbi:MAG: hypothetical protein ACI4SM_04310 [Candidatus Gastranaerophilaceae bacterium]